MVLDMSMILITERRKREGSRRRGIVHRGASFVYGLRVKSYIDAEGGKSSSSLLFFTFPSSLIINTNFPINLRNENILWSSKSRATEIRNAWIPKGSHTP